MADDLLVFALTGCGCHCATSPRWPGSLSQPTTQLAFTRPRLTAECNLFTFCVFLHSLDLESLSREGCSFWVVSHQDGVADPNFVKMQFIGELTGCQAVARIQLIAFVIPSCRRNLPHPSGLEISMVTNTVTPVCVGQGSASGLPSCVAERGDARGCCTEEYFSPLARRTSSSPKEFKKI